MTVSAHGRKSVLVLGGTGTIGRATVAALAADGHDVTCAVRKPSDGAPPSVRAVACDATDGAALHDLMASGRFDTLVSCLASRSGSPADAWAIDHDAHVAALRAAEETGIGHFILLSAICVQKPKLEFQRAKLAFEAALQASGLDWTIIRPTAYFKSLSGQIARVQAGKPFLVFGEGTLTACKPISDRDLGRFISTCVTDADMRNRVLPIGGPGPALTPLDQAQILEQALGRPVPIRRVPVALMDTIIGGLSLAGRVLPRFRDMAEFARTGRYYATESMLVWDEARCCYDAEATPEYGSETLRDHYAAVLRGEVSVDLGAHAVF